ncbi:MAG: hypothetical protein IKI49_00975 [Oscillospiraceae bacterium]|nr:hypothetical protein [Oscillospiraceae bacterium]
MKKVLAVLLIAALVLTMAACGSKPAGKDNADKKGNEEVETAKSVYTIYNRTGADLTEAYIYEAGSSDKGENLADQFHGNHATIDRGELPKGVDFVLEFTNADGYTGKFETLHAEEAPITLLAEDAKSGATAIAFETPVEPAQYKIVNNSGEKLTEAYIYPVGSSDKGENFAEGGMEPGAEVDVDYGNQSVDIKYIVEYTTESGRNEHFDTLSVEIATLYILAEDAMTGATPLSFLPPQN